MPMLDNRASLAALLQEVERHHLEVFERWDRVRGAFVVEDAYVPDLALEHMQVDRISREVQARLGRAVGLVDPAVGELRGVVDDEGALELDPAARATAVALAF